MDITPRDPAGHFGQNPECNGTRSPKLSRAFAVGEAQVCFDVLAAAGERLQDIQNESGRHNDLRGHKASLVAAQRDSRRRVRLVRRMVVGKFASSVLPHEIFACAFAPVENEQK